MKNNNTRKIYKKDKQHSSLVLENYKGLLWSIDNDWIITLYKGKYKTFFLAAEKQMEGEKLSMESINGFPPGIIENVEKTFAGENQNWISEYNGAVFHSYSSPIFDDEGKVAVVSGSTDDITETIKLQRTLEDASRAKSAFLAKMSHEIRTPMNAIIGMTELAMREKISPSIQDHIITIKQAGANLLSLINDILDFSKIETGKLEIVPSEYFFSSMIYDVISIINTKVLESRLRFLVYIDNNIPNALFGDAARIRQIMINLLSNAFKYTEKGFVSFSVTGTITDESRVDITIEVTDTGKGIKEEDKEKLFDEFTRLDTSNNRGVEGTGLGLAITKNLVKEMNGTIYFSSVYGQGSTFTVILPQKIRRRSKLAEVKNPEKIKMLVYERRDISMNSIKKTLDSLGIDYFIATAESNFYNKLSSNKFSFVLSAAVLYERVKKKYPGFKSNAKFLLMADFGEKAEDDNVSILNTPVFSIPIVNFLNGVTETYKLTSNYESIVKFYAPDAKVLVVDDINSNLKVAEGLLLPYKMKVDVCKNGASAMEAVKNEYYDLIFMDHMMPEMDGIEAAARIRAMGSKESYFNNVPMIALTANAVSGIEEMFLDNGFDDFLSKPIDIFKLNTVLEKWIPKEKQIGSMGKRRADSELQSINDYEDLDIKGLNIKKGITFAGGSIKNYLKLLKIFCQDVIEKMDEIKQCIETENLPLYAIHVHALKSACANVGADDLSEAARELEAEALGIAKRQEDFAVIHDKNNTFMTELKTILNNIKLIIKRANTDKNRNFTDINLLKNELLRLKAALSSFDSISIKKTVNKLKEFTSSSEAGVDVEAILKNILIGEHEEAAALVEVLLLKNNEKEN